MPAILAVAGAFFTAARASPTHFRTSSLDALAGFPALAFATRLLLPEFRLTAAMVVRLIGLYAVILACFAVVAIPLFLGARYVPALTWLLFGLAFIGVWLTVKMALTSAIYTLQSGRNIGVFQALGESTDAVSGDLWWTIVGLNIGIALLCMLLPGILAVVLYWSLAAYPFPAAFAAALLSYAGSIPGYVWVQLSLTGIASTVTPVARIETTA